MGNILPELNAFKTILFTLDILEHIIGDITEQG